MKKSVIGIAKSQDQAENIVDRLIQEDFSNSDISVLMSHNKTSSFDAPAAPGNARRPVVRESSTIKHQNTTKAPEGATTGAISGGLIGGTLGLLAGLGTLAIPGLGPFIAAGPIMAALSGSAVGGSVGLLIGALAGLGIPEYEAKQYEARLKKGGILISVHTETDQELDRAKKVFESAGAESISVVSEKQKAKNY